MAKDREIVCIHYLCEGKCDLGKDGTFNRKCQTCKTYKKKPGAKPRRVDLRQQKMERIRKKDKWD